MVFMISFVVMGVGVRSVRSVTVLPFDLPASEPAHLPQKSFRVHMIGSGNFVGCGFDDPTGKNLDFNFVAHYFSVLVIVIVMDFSGRERRKAIIPHRSLSVL